MPLPILIPPVLPSSVLPNRAETISQVIHYHVDDLKHDCQWIEDVVFQTSDHLVWCEEEEPLVKLQALPHERLLILGGKAVREFEKVSPHGGSQSPPR